MHKNVSALLRSHRKKKKYVVGVPGTTEVKEQGVAVFFILHVSRASSNVDPRNFHYAKATQSNKNIQ